MIAYQRLRAESGRAGDKNTLQGLLCIVRAVCGPFVWVPQDPARVLTTPLCFAFTFCKIMIRPDWSLVGTGHLRISIWKGSWISDHPTQYHEISTEPSHVFFQNVIYNITIHALAVSTSHKFPETRLSATAKIRLFAKRIYEGGFPQIYVIALHYYYLSRSTFEREFFFPQSIIIVCYKPFIF